MLKRLDIDSWILALKAKYLSNVGIKCRMYGVVFTKVVITFFTVVCMYIFGIQLMVFKLYRIVLHEIYFAFIHCTLHNFVSNSLSSLKKPDKVGIKLVKHVK